MAIDPAQLADWGAAYEAQGEIQKQEIASRYKLGKAQIAGNYKIAMLQNGVSQQTDENTREYQRGLLAQAAAEMQNIGIPELAVKKFIAETNAEIARGELQIKQGAAQLEQQKFGLSQQQFEEQKRQFAQSFGIEEAGVTGTYGGAPTLAARTQEEQLAQGWAGMSGYLPGGQQTLAGQAQQFNQGISAAGLTGTYGGQQTLAGRQQALDEAERQRVEAERQRQYALSVGQFGAQLASTPDRYFQARRFAALDAPRLLGQDTSGASVEGGPTPQIGTMGAYLTGADPAAGYVPAPAFGSYGAQPPPGGYPPGYGPENYDPYGQRAAGGALPAGGAYQPPAGGYPPGYGPENYDPYGQRAAGVPVSGGPAYTTTYGGPTGSAPAYGGISPSGTSGRGADTAGADVLSGGRVSQVEGGGYGYSSAPSLAASAANDMRASGGYGAGSAPGTDPRTRQLAQIAKASPPSPYDGLSESDSATLRLMESIYKRGGAGIQGGELERLKASGNYGFLQSAGSLLGYDPNQLAYDYNRYRPAQGSAALAG
jgi:hypothetical protein